MVSGTVHTVQKYLDMADIAELWGVGRATMRHYKYQGRLPEPDAVTGSGHGQRYGWLPETIAAIKRPGRGARTDLRPASQHSGTPDQPAFKSRSSRRSTPSPP